MSIPFAMSIQQAHDGPRPRTSIITGPTIGRIGVGDPLVVWGAFGGQARTRVCAIVGVPRGGERCARSGLVVDSVEPFAVTQLVGGIAQDPGVIARVFWSRAPSSDRLVDSAVFDLAGGTAHGLYQQSGGIAAMLVFGGALPLNATLADALVRIRLSNGSCVERSHLEPIRQGWAVPLVRIYRRAGQPVMVTAPSGPASLDEPVSYLSDTNSESGWILSQQLLGPAQVQLPAGSGERGVVIGMPQPLAA